ncbi:MAG: DNA phosphorothioation-associated putative methyltransferase [Cyanosarcina radialis HA8281-LM2]|jgi:DNA phosphorothioation-associated putative methyltransferase|nr:DNA phosphorothioation-associated putative methyltransferase [Cyanosarcina radialis HA8281-LM2]
MEPSPIQNLKSKIGTVPRHKAAMKRTRYSATISAAIEARILTKNRTHLDYGCGYGDDVKRLRSMGYYSVGYDPYYFPSTPLVRSDVVTLSYVLNTIESLVEREEVLVRCWELASSVLVVSALIGNKQNRPAFADGILTLRGTFEKYYGAPQLREFVEDVIGLTAMRLRQGVYAFFKQPTQVMTISSYSRERLLEMEKLLRSDANDLTRDWIPALDVFLEKYTTGSYVYYRLRSPNRTLPKGAKCLHLGVAGSERYIWGMKALESRERLAIANRRLAKILARLSEL